MSKKQWGHGYFKGIEESTDLVGTWFHSIVDGEIEWQGVIKKELKNDNFLIQLFSWVDGTPTDQKIVSFDTLKDWKFYQDSFSMRKYWAEKNGYSDYDFESESRYLDIINK